MKVVINKCFGGFSLSEAAILRYAEIKGLTVYPEKTKFNFTRYWTVPEGQRTPELPNWYVASLDERVANSKAHEAEHLYDRDIKRDDPALVQTVEELGTAADGGCAQLRVIEIPDGIDWEIAEYDGMESIEEVHRSWS